jgi:hypothetical protein
MQADFPACFFLPKKKFSSQQISEGEAPFNITLALQFFL